MGQRFQRQVVVVTGASSGIGRSTAHAFARDGARVVLGARRKDQLEEAAASMRHGGREARAIPCNVVVPQQLTRLMHAATDRWNRLDVVVANAGVGLTGDLVETDREDLRHVFEVNVIGVVNTIQAALPFMIQQGHGTIVIVSSVLGYRGIPRMTGYCGTKAALNAISEGLRTELAPKGINVLLACPGLTSTEFSDRRLGTRPPVAVGKYMSADAVGQAIVDAVHSRKKRIVLTPGGKFLAAASRHVPWLVDRFMAKWHHGMEAADAAATSASAPVS